MDQALIIARGLHFIATALFTGVVFFRVFVERAEPQHQLQGYHGRMQSIFWLSLVLAFVSGAGWLIAVAASIEGTSWSQSLTDGTAVTVLTGTQFGQAWLVRFVSGTLLVASVTVLDSGSPFTRFLVLIFAVVLAGGMAFGGHASATVGMAGTVHLASDTLHIVAASAWLGGLLPYALFLAASAQSTVLRATTRRFSILGIVAVLTIFATGVINTFYLVGILHALFNSNYGRLLSIKIGLFLIMVGVASINRFTLTPRLPKRVAIMQLKRNSLLEMALGLAILAIVAVLGTMMPASIEHAGMHH